MGDSGRRPRNTTMNNTPTDSGDYHAFKGNATGTHTFASDDGTARAAIDFFKQNSNAYELYKTLNDKDKEAWYEWCTGWFMGGEMYGNLSKLPPKVQDWIRSYDKIIDKARLYQGITVYRDSTFELINNGSSMSLDLNQLKRMEGNIVTCKSMMSCAAANTGLLIGSSKASKPVVYKINIPPSIGAGIWVGDDSINPTWGAIQREYVTSRDSAFKVGKSYKQPDGRYVVELTWIGKEKHTWQ